jgi:alkylation response protein AidB-like acyl-CoA dehydrogenase
MPPVVRSLPTPEAHELLALTRELVEREVAPRAGGRARPAASSRASCSARSARPGCWACRTTRSSAARQPYEVYLQVLEELSRGWLAVGLGTSVHTLACYPLAAFGTDEQRDRWLPDMLGGELLGAYCLSEAGSGSTRRRCRPGRCSTATLGRSTAPRRG